MMNFFYRINSLMMTKCLELLFSVLSDIILKCLFFKRVFSFFSRNYYPEAIFKHVSLYYMWCRRQWLSLWSISISFGVNLELEWGNKAMILYLRTHHIWIELWIELKSDVFLYLSSYQKDNSFLSRFPTVKWK